MEKDRHIGRVLNVDSFKVLIDIDKENKSLTKTHYYGIYPVARINSYVIIPVGYEKIVGHITKVQMFTEAEGSLNKTTITLPTVKRLIWATMIGTIKKRGDDEYYEQGITSFLSLDNPVCFILKNELDLIFDKNTKYTPPEQQKNVPKSFYVPIGKSTAFPEYEIKIDPDALFSKHLAILGNTGSGKSCTIASLIQTLLKKDYGSKKITNAHFIILDTNGEYSSAFIKRDKEGKPNERIGDCLVINKEGLNIPYWFMNFEDFKTLFKATEGSQAPVLNTALVLAKEKVKGENPVTTFLLICNVLREIYDRVLSTEENWKKATPLYSSCNNALTMLDSNKVQLDTYFVKKSMGISTDEIKNGVSQITKHLEVNPKNPQYYNFKAGVDLSTYPKWYEKYQTIFDSVSTGFDMAQSIIDADMPIYFEKANFVSNYLYPAMNIEGRENSRIREYCSTLILRMNSFFNDERYKILFDDYENFPYALATFLRYCFGRMENAKMAEFGKESGGNKSGKPPFLDYYLKEQELPEGKGKNHQIIIFDMSLLSSDILENITALLGRLVLEFLQRMGKRQEDRGSFPVVLVLEEAHNYIPEKKRSEEKEPISKIVFERIAREGRKFGLSLVVSSQRPSELSKTVLSQCNSFIVHRIQNPEDQKYIQTIVPSINEDLLKQLPSLAQRTALIFGDCVRAPAQLYMNQADPLPDSRDPKFMKHWLKLDTTQKEEPDFEKICEEWEGGKSKGKK